MHHYSSEACVVKNYLFHAEMETMLCNSVPMQIASRHSVLRIMRLACSLVHLNMLESAFLSWLLRHSKYNLKELPSIKEKITCDKEVESNNAESEKDENSGQLKIETDKLDKKLLLLVLLNAYHVKAFLRD